MIRRLLREQGDMCSMTVLGPESSLDREGWLSMVGWTCDGMMSMNAFGGKNKNKNRKRYMSYIFFLFFLQGILDYQTRFQDIMEWCLFKHYPHHTLLRRQVIDSLH
ncbi:hypothetical protein BJ165DRAFT_507044 [Panaeolus papilionaceus]|nr:hypothetical protein BJ165DRAFT_507044 [Panaeolus papilionaceus]